MSDIWSTVGTLDPETQSRLASVLETRGENAGQQAMRDAFLGRLSIPANATVLDAGCGTGVLTRRIARDTDT